jgi:two-component system sensor histidine kinase CreC
MKIFPRILAGIIAVTGVGFAFLLFWIIRDLEPQYRKVTEEPLADIAYTFASLAAVASRGDRIDTTLFERMFRDVQNRSFSARIHDFTKLDMDLHVYITDKKGIVLFDSDNGNAVGRDYSRWNDIYAALKGRYGTRTTKTQIDDSASTIMYVATPIVREGRVLGVLSVGKPTTSSDLFVAASRRRILLAGAAVCLAVLTTAAIVSGMFTRPLERLANYALMVKEGKRSGLPDLGSSEIRQLGLAFEEMRDALEGRKYIERYVETLTHEIKSPLSAIQGAAELLEDEDMQQEKKQRFLGNIRGETDRIRTLVDELLLLSSLESRKTRVDAESLDLNEIAAHAIENMAPMIEQKHIRLDSSLEGTLPFRGERSLIEHAITNILQNSVEFTPQDGVISVKTSAARDGHVECIVEDSGPGIPQYALQRIFERFYSLKRPDTGKKSSGLGLSLVREIMTLHNGAVDVQNRQPKGTRIILRFPLSPTV